MYFKLLSSPNRWKDSLNIGFAVLATIETALTITDIELDSFWGQCNWIIKLLLIVALFIIIVLITFICKYYISRRGISINKKSKSGREIYSQKMVGKLLRLTNILTQP